MYTHGRYMSVPGLRRVRLCVSSGVRAADLGLRAAAARLDPYLPQASLRLAALRRLDGLRHLRRRLQRRGAATRIFRRAENNAAVARRASLEQYVCLFKYMPAEEQLCWLRQEAGARNQLPCTTSWNGTDGDPQPCAPIQSWAMSTEVFNVLSTLAFAFDVGPSHVPILAELRGRTQAKGTAILCVVRAQISRLSRIDLLSSACVCWPS